MDLGLFLRHRFWIKCPRVGSLHSGWVVGAKKDTLEFEFSADPPSCQGGHLVCSITHAAGTAQFMIKVNSLEGRTAHVTIDSRINLVDSGQEARKLINREAKITIMGEQILGSVNDISESGMGVSTQIAVPVGTELECTIENDDGPLTIAGKVVYGTQDGTTYRSGILLKPFDRLTKARWHILLQEGERVVVQRNRAS